MTPWQSTNCGLVNVASIPTSGPIACFGMGQNPWYIGKHQNSWLMDGNSPNYGNIVLIGFGPSPHVIIFHHIPISFVFWPISKNTFQSACWHFLRPHCFPAAPRHGSTGSTNFINHFSCRCMGCWPRQRKKAGTPAPVSPPGHDFHRAFPTVINLRWRERMHHRMPRKHQVGWRGLGRMVIMSGLQWRCNFPLKALATFQLPAFCHATSATKQHVPHGRHDHDQPLETTEGNNQTDITIITSLKN